MGFRNRTQEPPVGQPIALSDESRLLLRTVYRTLQQNAAALDTAIAQVNANTNYLMGELAKTLATSDGIDLSERVLDLDTERWVVKPEGGADNGKVAS
ncbi:MAG: hypothetical protein GY906_22835 [bacterium]|nr:hypothetical protein [bacterium]